MAVSTGPDGADVDEAVGMTDDGARWIRRAGAAAVIADVAGDRVEAAEVDGVRMRPAAGADAIGPEAVRPSANPDSARDRLSEDSSSSSSSSTESRLTVDDND